MQYQLIHAVPSDANWLEDLRRTVYQDLFQATWGRWDEARHMRHFSECMKKGNISIIDWEGVRVGMVQLFEELDSVEIGEIQVQPSHQNRGIGSQVLSDIIADAQRHRKCVRLRVGLKNDKAFRLYERLGFRKIGQSETHNHMEYQPAA
jgi:ribosomal protein S18 acetylase RimI-like enzyme